MSDEIGEISTSSNGAGLDIEWKIGGFFYLSTTGDAYYCSPVFSFDGQAWYLGIYPNGDSSRDSTGHINVYLIKYLTIASTRQAFSLSLKTAKGEKYREKHSTKVFERAGDFHEFHRFLPRSELTRRSSELVPQGVLTVVCTMKSIVGIASKSLYAGILRNTWFQRSLLL